jgi:thioester reductase-like protein
MENILITGATGHLGKAVIEQLLMKISASQISVRKKSVQHLLIRAFRHTLQIMQMQILYKKQWLMWMRYC